jgi:hypothetical protein
LLTGDTDAVAEAADGAEAFIFDRLFDDCELQVKRRDDRGK